MKTVNYLFPVLCSLLAIIQPANAQDEEPDNRPVRPPFESAWLIDGQTVIVPVKGTFEFDIQHRFGTVQNGISDLYGLYAPSNIRLGFSYVPFDDLMIGFGTTKDDKLIDLNLKYSLLKQTRSGSIPVSVTYYGNLVRDNGENDHYDRPVQRISYFHELLISHKFGFKFSLQLSSTYSHFNGVDSLFDNDIFGLSANGRYKVAPQLAIIAGYDFQFNGHEKINIRPNASAGIEVATSGHAFQVFLGSFRQLVPQRNFAYNENDWTRGDVLIGFNITRLWNF